MRTTLTGVICLAVIGCSSAPDPVPAEPMNEAAVAVSPGMGGSMMHDDQDMIDFGDMPMAAERTIRHWFEQNVKNAEGARFTFGSAERGYYSNAAVGREGEMLNFAWVVPTVVRASSQDDSSTKQKTYHFWFRGDKLIAVVDPSHCNQRAAVSASLEP